MARRIILAVLTLAAVILSGGTTVVVAQSGQQEESSLNLLAYTELLRSDLRAQKVAIITEVVGFTEAEDAAFWPIYREYDREMSQLGDERVALIAEYARNYDQLTDATADKLAARALNLESRRQAAKARCYERVKKVLPPRTALRFLQVEHQLLLLIDLQISAALPVAPRRRRTWAHAPDIPG